MDLREKRTLKNIQNAFLNLRARKPLAKITVRELSELAEISKATFYLHYKDIYDLSESMEKQVILNFITDMGHPDIISEPALFTQKLTEAFYAQGSLIHILFADSRSNILPESLDKVLSEYFIRQYPKFAEDEQFLTKLTFEIFGSYHICRKYYGKFQSRSILDVVEQAAHTFFAGYKE